VLTVLIDTVVVCMVGVYVVSEAVVVAVRAMYIEYQVGSWFGSVYVVDSHMW